MKEHLKTLKKIQEQIAIILQLVSEWQTKYYDQCHKSMFYIIENEVLLSTKNLFTWRSFHKLKNKFREFFKIINVCDKQAYMLKLSKIMKEIHFTFHISLLELYHWWDVTGWTLDSLQANALSKNLFNHD